MSSYLQPDNTNVPFPFLLSEPSPGGTHFPVGRNGLSHPCLSSFSWSLWTHQGTSVLAVSQTTVKQVTLTAIPSASQYPCRSWSKLSNVLEFWVYNFPGTSTILKYLNKVHCHPQGPPDQNGARILNVNNKEKFNKNGSIVLHMWNDWHIFKYYNKMCYFKKDLKFAPGIRHQKDST